MGELTCGRVGSCTAGPVGADLGDTAFRRMMTDVADAILIHDRKGRILDANRRASANLGYSPLELRTMTVYDVEAGLPSETLEAVWDSVLSGDVVSMEGCERRRDGSTFPVEVRLSRILAEGEPVVVAMIRDVTARHWAGGQGTHTAEEVKRLKDHFLSTISHELRTPLALIVGYAELLEDTCPQTRDLVAGIQDGCRRLTEHIGRMLDFSALVSGSLDVDRSDLDLPEVVQAAAALMADQFQQKGLELVVQAEPGTPTVMGDARRMTQILLELLGNALKVSDPGGTVGIRIAPCGDQARLDVWDTGPGIAPRDLPRIWEAFSQLELDDAFRRGGLGLGLTLVKQLVQLHEGKLGLVSREGKGTVFSLFLPNSEGCMGCA